MPVVIQNARTPKEIMACVETLRQLRPHLDADTFLDRIESLNQTSGFRLVSLSEGNVKAVAGYKISDWLAAGKYLEIEDLITAEGERSKGYGGALFDWLLNLAAQQNCTQLRLLSGVFRKDAHRFYLDRGMVFEAHYFSINVGQ